MSTTDWIANMGFYNQVKGDLLRALIYGPPGSGKTTFSATFPTPLFLDYDDGGRTLRNLSIPFIPFERGEETYGQVLDILACLRKALAPEAPQEPERVALLRGLAPKTLVFDSGMNLSEFLMVDEMLRPTAGSKREKRDPAYHKPDWDDYALIQARLKSIIKSAQRLPINVVMTAGVSLEKDDKLGTFIGHPAFVGKYRNIVGHDFDELILLTVEQGVHTAHTTAFRYYECKSRSSVTDCKSPTFEKLYSGGASPPGEEKK